LTIISSLQQDDALINQCTRGAIYEKGSNYQFQRWSGKNHAIVSLGLLSVEKRPSASRPSIKSFGRHAAAPMGCANQEEQHSKSYF
jgi:hypothetical protein